MKITLLIMSLGFFREGFFEEQEQSIPTASVPRHIRVTSPLPLGEDNKCLSLLAMETVEFEEGPLTEGIATPVQIRDGKMGEVKLSAYYSSLPRALHTMDCRLALALARATTVLARSGVTEIFFTTHYRPSYGLLKPGHYYAHTMGLAIDIKGFRVGNALVWIEEDYEPGLGFMNLYSCLGEPATVKGMVLRKILCDLDEADIFESILTPDFDEVHWNHFHIQAFHPGDDLQIRSRGTALAEVPLTALTPWAVSRPAKHDESARRWERVALKPWPKEFFWVRTELGLLDDPPPPQVDTKHMLSIWDWIQSKLDPLPDSKILSIERSLNNVIPAL